MNLVLLGPPGSGKGTQANHITAALNIPHISTGDIIREAIKKQTPLGMQFQSYADSGQLVPDTLVTDLVKERLVEPDCQNGFLCDGFPRTLFQAESLKKILNEKQKKIDAVLLLEVDEIMLFERITGRRSDPETGRLYHLTFDPPPPHLLPRLIHRADDKEDVIRERLNEYHQKTAPLIPFYEQENCLKRIQNKGTPDQVWAEIKTVLDTCSTDAAKG